MSLLPDYSDDEGPIRKKVVIARDYSDPESEEEMESRAKVVVAAGQSILTLLPKPIHILKEEKQVPLPTIPDSSSFFSFKKQERREEGTIEIVKREEEEETDHPIAMPIQSTNFIEITQKSQLDRIRIPLNGTEEDDRGFKRHKIKL